MPVTFETDLQDLKNFDYVPQIPLDALFKNLGYKQAKYDQGFQQAQRVADQLKVKAYGQDIARRDEIINEVNQQLQQFSGADFSDPATVNKFSAYVSSVASNPELLGMESRATWYDQMKAKRDKITADGTYLSPEDDPTGQAEQYFAGAEPYNPNKRFNGNVYKPVDFVKFEEDIAKAVNEEEFIDPNKMYDEKYKVKTYNRFRDNWLNAVTKNPEYFSKLKRKFDYEHQGTDWANISTLETYKGVTDLRNVQQQYAALINSPNTSEADKAKYQANLQEAQRQEQILTANFQNLNPYARKELAWKAFLDENAHNFSIGRMSTSHTDHTLNKVTEMNMKANLDWQNAQREAVLKSSLETGRVTVNEKGNITGYEAGTIPVKPTSSTRTVRVGNQTMDHDAFNYYADSNDPNFIQGLITDKDFTITKDGARLVQTPLTTSVANADGTYTITGKFTAPVLDDDGKPVLENGQPTYAVQNKSVTVTNQDVKRAYMGQNVGSFKKTPPPNGTYTTDQNEITTNQAVPDAAGNIVIPKGTKVKSYATATDAAKDATLPDNSYFFDESTNTYKKLGK